MIYVPDTNVLVARLNGNLSIAARLKKLKPEEVVLAAPVLAELRYGASYSGRPVENLERVERTAAGMPFRSFDAAAARRFGDLKAALRRRGITKSDFDFSIAAIAFELGAVLVSDDRAFHEARSRDSRSRTGSPSPSRSFAANARPPGRPSGAVRPQFGCATTACFSVGTARSTLRITLSWRGPNWSRVLIATACGCGGRL